MEKNPLSCVSVVVCEAAAADREGVKKDIEKRCVKWRKRRTITEKEKWREGCVGT